MKVIIGSKYEGPSWDRPALRQLPRYWVLEETRDRFVFWRQEDFWVGVATVVVIFGAAILSIIL